MAMMPSYKFTRTCRIEDCDNTFDVWYYNPFVSTLCTGCRELETECDDA